MLTRRTLLAASAAGLAAPATIGTTQAATPKAAVVMAKSIDDIVGGFDPAQSYEFSNNEGCGNIYRKLVAPDPADSAHEAADQAPQLPLDLPPAEAAARARRRGFRVISR